ncbi:MAG: YmdB family metallophosphoesterase [Spirochaetes bacterium]|uniref:YmdB family metallophosphoesterase n=1 Tax=Candidatus Ornithospirochaeta stercoravium TaxID=2840897 RepID=A0A9D9ICB2_9SPIO|nr:YmdB family metallophosphoesterase [Candidatus Ornithospirochaeta stercoravium]
MVRILFLGEITGRPGITCLKSGLVDIQKKYEIDYTVANGEGMTGGFGIGRAHAAQLTKMGVDLVTGAEKLFYKIDMVEFVQKAGFVLRPANYPPQCPGRSYRIIEIKGRKLVIINLQGNSLFPRQSIQNAFSSIDSLLKKLQEKEPDLIPLIFFHAATTAEKKTMRFFLDGRAAAVIGTHTKVITADEMVTEAGLAYITDNGRVGSFMSVGGFDPATEIKKLRSQLPVRSQECWNEGIIEGAVVDIDQNVVIAACRRYQMNEVHDVADGLVSRTGIGSELREA